MAEVPVPLEEGALRAYLTGRDVYRRTRYVIARNGGACMLAEVTKRSEQPLFSPVTSVTVLARADETVLVDAPDVDTAVPTQLARAAAGTPGARRVIVRGPTATSLHPDPAPVRIRVLRWSRPAAKLADSAGAGRRRGPAASQLARAGRPQGHNRLLPRGCVSLPVAPGAGGPAEVSCPDEIRRAGCGRWSGAHPRPSDCSTATECHRWDMCPCNPRAGRPAARCRPVLLLETGRLRRRHDDRARGVSLAQISGLRLAVSARPVHDTPDDRPDAVSSLTGTWGTDEARAVLGEEGRRRLARGDHGMARSRPGGLIPVQAAELIAEHARADRIDLALRPMARQASHSMLG